MKACRSTWTLCSFEGVLRTAGERRRKRERKRAKRPEVRARDGDIKVSGDNGWREPPVPIPNTEVKPPNADGTELGTAWESRKSPGSKSGSGRNGSFSRSGNERGRDGRKARPAMILSSSMAEHSAVNRRVVSSSLT